MISILNFFTPNIPFCDGQYYVSTGPPYMESGIKFADEIKFAYLIWPR